MRLFWSRRALHDLEEIRRFIARDSPEAATRWIARLQARSPDVVVAPRARRVVPEIGRHDLKEVLIKG